MSANTLPTVLPATMTSLEMVDLINGQREPGEAVLRHDDFLRKVPKVLGEEAAPKFCGTAFYTVNGATRERPIYRFPKREACLMAMSYSFELQAKVFDRMTELEERERRPVQKQQVPQSFREALLLAAEQQGKIEEQRAKIESDAPKVLTFDTVVAERSDSCVDYARRFPGVNLNAVLSSLKSLGYLYNREQGSYRVYAEFRDVLFTEKLSQEKGYVTICPTAKGKELLAKLYQHGQLTMKKGFGRE